MYHFDRIVIFVTSVFNEQMVNVVIRFLGLFKLEDQFSGSKYKLLISI